jgi:hypothetical protein
MLRCQLVRGQFCGRSFGYSRENGGNRAAKPKLAGSPQRKAEDFAEVRLVAMPSDADADIVLRAKDLADASRR